MNGLTRRGALQQTAGIGLLAALVPGASARGDEVPKEEREHVIAAGMTEAEANCWISLADAAGEYLGLPEIHPMDRQEAATAFHVIQNKLLSRVTYRKYLEIKKAPAK